MVKNFSSFFISIWIHGFLVYSKGYNIAIIIWMYLTHILPVQALQVLLCPSACLISLTFKMLLFFETSFLSGIIQCSRFILYFLCPSISPQGAMVPLSVFRNQDLGAKCAHRYWGIAASRPSVDRDGK